MKRVSTLTKVQNVSTSGITSPVKRRHRDLNKVQDQLRAVSTSETRGISAADIAELEDRDSGMSVIGTRLRYWTKVLRTKLKLLKL